MYLYSFLISSSLVEELDYRGRARYSPQLTSPECCTSVSFNVYATSSNIGGHSCLCRVCTQLGIVCDSCIQKSTGEADGLLDGSWRLIPADQCYVLPSIREIRMERTHWTAQQRVINHLLYWYKRRISQSY